MKARISFPRGETKKKQNKKNFFDFGKILLLGKWIPTVLGKEPEESFFYLLILHQKILPQILRANKGTQTHATSHQKNKKST